MAVAFDAQGHIDTGAASAAFTSLSGTPITIGSGSNRAIAVCLNFGQTAAALPTGITVTCGGVAMTAITNASVAGSGVFCSAIWFGLVAPASGTPTIAAAWTGNRSCVMGAISVTGADQTGGVTTFAHGASHATGTLDASWTVTITSAVGNLTAACYVDDGGTNVSSTSATQDWLDNTCFGNHSAMNHTAGSASNVMTATPAASEATTAAGFDFVAAAASFQWYPMSFMNFFTELPIIRPILDIIGY